MNHKIVKHVLKCLTFSPSEVWIDNMDKADLCFFTSLTLDAGITTCNTLIKYFESWCLHSLCHEKTQVVSLLLLLFQCYTISSVWTSIPLNVSDWVTLVSLSSMDEWKHTWFSETKSFPWYSSSFCKAQVNATIEIHTHVHANFEVVNWCFTVLPRQQKHACWVIYLSVSADSLWTAWQTRHYAALKAVKKKI